jgi:DNA-binding transcriptional LysR family regulator
MLDLSRLPYLHAVHVHGSVGAAARALGYTPSAVSQHIGKLEREVGTRLLEPVGRGVTLTDAALILVDAAEAVRAASETAQARLEELDGDLAGTLRVACFPSAIRGVAAPALGSLSAAAPELHFQLREMTPDDGHEAVAGGHVDVALVHDWEHEQGSFSAGLEKRHLADDPVDLAVPADHPLARRTSVSLTETVEEVWVTDVSQGICTRWIIDMLHEHNEHPRIAFRVEEYASQLALVAAGLCVSVLPRLGRPPLPDGVRTVPLTGPVPIRRFVALYRQTSAPRPAIHRLIEEMRRQLSRAEAA